MHIHNCLSKPFSRGYFKSLLNNSYVFFILILFSIDYLFFIQVEILVFGAKRDFHSTHDILSTMRLWILFKTVVLAASTVTALAGLGLECCCVIDISEWKSSSPTKRLLTQMGREQAGLLITPLLGLHCHHSGWEG